MEEFLNSVKLKLEFDNIKMYCCDCMDAMKLVPDNYYELAVVDTPYGIDVNMNAGKKKGEKDRYDKKDWDKNIPSESYFIELQRISQNQIVWGCNYFSKYLWSAGRISWFKNNGANNDFSDCELAMHTFNNRVTNVSIQWSGFIKPQIEKNETRIHPTQKPIQLYKWLLKNYAKEGDKIFDSHGGSFSSAIACYEMGFDFTGFEIDEEYFRDAVERIRLVTAQNKLF